jgi:TolA-binding protein
MADAPITSSQLQDDSPDDLARLKLPVILGILVAIVATSGVMLWKTQKVEAANKLAISWHEAKTLEERVKVVTEQRLQPSLAPFVLRVAREQFDASQFAESVQLLDKFEKDFPGHALTPSVRLMRALGLEAKGDAAAARSLLESLVASAKDSSVTALAYLHLARVRLAANDVSGARQALEELTAKYESSPLAEEARQRLSTLPRS